MLTQGRVVLTWVSMTHTLTCPHPNWSVVPKQLGTTALEDRNKIQNDLDRMEHWAKSNRMTFNREKCKPLHLGKRSQFHSYKMGDTWLSKTMSKKDLVIVIDHKLNMSQQCDVATKNQMLF